MNMDWLKGRFGLAALGVASALFLLFVWPTLYRYDRIGGGSSSLPVRINRVTGTAEMLRPDVGWAPMGSVASRDREGTPRSLTSTDRGRIDLSQLRWESTGFIKGTMYNPTNYRLTEISFRVEVYDKRDKTKALDREYRVTVYIAPRSVGDVLFDAGFKLGSEHEWGAYVSEAKGTSTDGK